MQLEHVTDLARNTPTEALMEAWGACSSNVAAAINGERPMTIREAGALAELHGMKLLDVLAV